MALSAAEGTFNAAAATFWAAWKTYLDTLSTGATVRVCFPSYSEDGTNFPEFDPTQGQDSFEFRNVTSEYPHQVNGKILFFKVTNAAGDLTT